MEFQIRVLGPVELRAGEHVSALGSTKERTVLAALAWDAGSGVSVDRLVDRVWDEEPPGKPRDALYAYVSRIRRALFAVAGPAAPVIERRTHTYILRADRTAVDLHRYVDLVDRAHAVAHRGEGGEALRLLRQARALRRGEPLAGLPGRWPADVRAAMDEKDVDAAVLEAGIALRMGRFADLAPRLTALAAEHPTNETLVELLAVVLYRTGRAVEAAEKLHHYLGRLVREFGTVPGERLQAVQRGVLGRTLPADLPGPAPGAAAEPADPRPERTGGLPRAIELVGRAAEMRRLTAAFDTPREGADPVVLVAVDGMPGVGKTSLAVHAAHRLRDRYPDGCLFMDLRGGADGGAMSTDDALAELLQQSGVPAARLPQHPEALAAAWHTVMADRRVIVVLDNAAGADQVRRLLPWGSPSLVILTSRHRLTEIPGVRPVTLDVMPPRDAVAMFRRRVGPERAPDTDTTARIVRLCGFLPLAIELVASRFLARPAWSAAELVDTLTRAGSSRVPQIRDGHRDLGRAFEVSYRPLTPLQQMVFRRLGSHPGPETGPHAAAALSGLSVEDTDRALEGLLACHLLEEPTAHRYRLHDLLRDYAQGLAAAEDGPRETRAGVERLVDFYLATADLADRQAYPFRCRIDVDAPRPAPAPWGSRGDPSRWLVTEGPNLLAALAWSGANRPAGDTALLAHVLAGFLDTEGYLTTADTVLRRAVSHWRDTGDRAAYACVLLDLSVVSIHGGRYDDASDAARSALEVARALGDPAIEAEALHQLGISLWPSGRYAQAVACHRAALELRADGPGLQQARSLNGLGIVLLERGDHEGALAVFLDALGKFREVGDQRGEWRTLNNVGEIHAALGDFARADTAYRQALALARHVGSRVDCATLQMNLARTLAATGRPDESLALYEEVLPVLRSVGDRRTEAIALHGLGRTLQSTGRFDESITRHKAALAVAREIGAVHEEAETLRDLGIAEHRVGLLGEAGAHLRESLAIAERIQAPAEETATLLALADLRGDEGRPREAEALRARVRALQAKHRLPGA